MNVKTQSHSLQLTQKGYYRTVDRIKYDHGVCFVYTR